MAQKDLRLRDENSHRGHRSSTERSPPHSPVYRFSRWRAARTFASDSSCFLLTSLPTALADEEEYLDPTYGDEPSALSRRAEYLNKTFKCFWRRWREEYLTALREKHSATKGKLEELIQVGDIVLIHGDSLRINWKYARVDSLIRSEDGVVRAVNVWTADGLTNRPISKLYPLEVRAKIISPSTASSVPAETVQQLPPVSPNQTNQLPAQRKRRDAAIRAAERIRTIAEEPEDDSY
jgi:hypothetical protein